MPERTNIEEKTKKLIADNFRNTDLGLKRIAKNLGLQGMADTDVANHCHKIILSTPVSEIEIRGKNFYLYCQKYSAVLTINRSSLGIITAKQSP